MGGDGRRRKATRGARGYAQGPIGSKQEAAKFERLNFGGSKDAAEDEPPKKTSQVQVVRRLRLKPAAAEGFPSRPQGGGTSTPFAQDFSSAGI